LAATGLAGEVGRDGGADARAGAAGFAAGAGLLASCGLAGAVAADGLAGAGLVAGAAFFTERIALPPEGFAAATDFVGAADFPDPAVPFFSRLRIFPASSSLIELLWLLAAIESFSAASSTSLFSRPRSLDSS
jgi:hypothetical protein